MLLSQLCECTVVLPQLIVFLSVCGVQSTVACFKLANTSKLLHTHTVPYVTLNVARLLQIDLLLRTIAENTEMLECRNRSRQRNQSALIKKKCPNCCGMCDCLSGRQPVGHELSTEPTPENFRNSIDIIYWLIQLRKISTGLAITFQKDFVFNIFPSKHALQCIVRVLDACTPSNKSLASLQNCIADEIEISRVRFTKKII